MNKPEQIDDKSQGQIMIHALIVAGFTRHIAPKFTILQFGQVGQIHTLRGRPFLEEYRLCTHHLVIRSADSDCSQQPPVGGNQAANCCRPSVIVCPIQLRDSSGGTGSSYCLFTGLSLSPRGVVCCILLCQYWFFVGQKLSQMWVAFVCELEKNMKESPECAKRKKNRK